MTPVHLVTKENIEFDGGPQNVFDPDNGYRDAYKKIWGGQLTARPRLTGPIAGVRRSVRQSVSSERKP